MQDIKLLVNLEDGTVNNHYNIPLPCSLNKNGCDSGSTDPYAYTWENREKCIIEELHTAPVKMIQMDRKYYIVREYETEPEQKLLLDVRNHLKGHEIPLFFRFIIIQSQFVTQTK